MIRHHLQLGECAPHAIPVDHAKPATGGKNQWQECIDAADLRAQNSARLLVTISLHETQSRNHLIPVGQLLDEHCGRPHHRERHHKIGITEGVGLDQLDRAMIANRLSQHE